MKELNALERVHLHLLEAWLKAMRENDSDARDWYGEAMDYITLMLPDRKYTPTFWGKVTAMMGR